ncbi:MAG TPA: beta-galactosidase [Acidobacteriaceae bacterium]|nr:beta-galactosidase [Acidobacteriaceae bacterium]
MNLRRLFLCPLVFALTSLATFSFAQTAPPIPDGKPHTFVVQGSQFLLDGKPFRIISGEMHYPRIPREYWRARLKMARAMGLNAITTYVFWNEHEPTPGVYDFSGNNDVAEFIREAQQEGLWVILRPGPYVCAEWDFGGLPAWLLKDPTTSVRSTDPKFMQPATRWLVRLGRELAPLQTGNGGPILLVQVENEYGGFGNDHVYMEQIKQAIVNAGFTKAQLYTADSAGSVPRGSLPELPVGINFGGSPGEAQREFAALKRLRPDNPMFNSEFWDGWFDHWGDRHAHTNGAAQAANLAWMLEQGASVSIYMFHGGTSFGWMNGANSDDRRKDYQPDVSSYDYDAALDESGRPTPKFFAFRDAIAKATGITPPPVPEVVAPIAIAPFRLTEAVSLWDSLPKPIESDHPLTMEEVGQNYGWILYRTQISGSSPSGSLTIHDYARIYLAQNADSGAVVDRRVNGAIAIESFVHGPADTTTPFEVLVENTGRINYSHQLLHERKGIVDYTPPQTSAPTKWQMYPLPMNNVESMHFKKAVCTGPCFYRGHFRVTKPADTFLDTSKLGKGQLWVNGHAMGRFWKIGPQKTLYIPGPWLKKGQNEVIIFDVDGTPSPQLEGLTKPNLGD